GRQPHAPQFVVRQDARARPLLRPGAPHTFDDRAAELIGTLGVPVKYVAREPEHLVRHDRAALVLDLVEQPRYLAALDRVDVPIAQYRINMSHKRRLTHADGAQALVLRPL